MTDSIEISINTTENDINMSNTAQNGLGIVETVVNPLLEEQTVVNSFKTPVQPQRTLDERRNFVDAGPTVEKHPRALEDELMGGNTDESENTDENEEENEDENTNENEEEEEDENEEENEDENTNENAAAPVKTIAEFMAHVDVRTIDLENVDAANFKIGNFTVADNGLIKALKNISPRRPNPEKEGATLSALVSVAYPFEKDLETLKLGEGSLAFLYKGQYYLVSDPTTLVQFVPVLTHWKSAKNMKCIVDVFRVLIPKGEDASAEVIVYKNGWRRVPLWDGPPARVNGEDVPMAEVFRRIGDFDLSGRGRTGWTLDKNSTEYKRILAELEQQRALLKLGGRELSDEQKKEYALLLDKDHGYVVTAGGKLSVTLAGALRIYVPHGDKNTQITQHVAKLLRDAKNAEQPDSNVVARHGANLRDLRKKRRRTEDKLRRMLRTMVAGAALAGEHFKPDPLQRYKAHIVDLAATAKDPISLTCISSEWEEEKNNRVAELEKQKAERREANKRKPQSPLEKARKMFLNMTPYQQQQFMAQLAQA